MNRLAKESAVKAPVDSGVVKPVAHSFVDAINQRSVQGIAALMTDDHVFVDSPGTRIEGKERMKAGWDGYLRMVPDYKIVIDETLDYGAQRKVRPAGWSTFI